MHDRGDGVEERQSGLAGQRADGVGQGRRRQRPGANDDGFSIACTNILNLFANDLNLRMSFNRLGDGAGEAVPVDRERPPGRHLIGVGGAHDQRSHAPHFPMQLADGVVFRIVRAKGVRTDEFGEAIGMMGVRPPDRPHFVEDDGDAGFGDLPGGFRSGEAGADHVDGLH